jgi:hypothetical protein
MNTTEIVIFPEGTEIYSEYLIPITTENGIKEGDSVLVQLLSRYYKLMVVNEGLESLNDNERLTYLSCFKDNKYYNCRYNQILYILSFDEKKHCWICNGFINDK